MPRLVLPLLSSLTLVGAGGCAARSFTSSGIRVEVSATAEGGPLRVGGPARLVVTVRDEAGSSPFSGLTPTLWAAPSAGVGCGDGAPPVGTGGFTTAEAEVVVLDATPGFSTFSAGGVGQHISLGGPARDWAISTDQRWLLVSEPERVEVYDTTWWRLAGTVPLSAPGPITVAPDGAYVWIPWIEGGQSGVVAVRPDDPTPTQRTVVGTGRLSLAISADSRWLYAVDSADGLLSVIDTHARAPIRRIETGPEPRDLAWSEAGHAVYVIHADGTIVVVDADTFTERARVRAGEALRRIRFSAEGRYALITAPTVPEVLLYDTATDRIIAHARTEHEPVEVALTPSRAYVRLAGAGLLATPPDRLGRSPEPLRLDPLPGMDLVLPERSTEAMSFQAAPDGGGWMAGVGGARPQRVRSGVAIRADGTDDLSVPGGTALGVLTVDRRLSERAPGRYESIVRFPTPGPWALSLRLPAPRVELCWVVNVRPARGRPDGSKRGF